jgi:hypothetical protein
VRGELAAHELPDDGPRSELGLPGEGEPHEGRDGEVAALLAEQRELEGRVRMLERLVVPVEAPARLGRRDEQAEEDCPEERVVLARAGTRVGMGEDRRGRLAPELLYGDKRVLACAKDGLPLLDERAHERLQLVQGRAAALDVLLERERQLGALLQLAPEDDEGPEDEAAEKRIEVRRSHGHASGYEARDPSPASRMRSFDAQPFDAAEVRLPSLAHQYRESEMQRRRSDLHVVCRDELAAPTKLGHERRPAFGDLAPEVDERDLREKMLERGALAVTEKRIPNCIGAREQLGEDDGGDGHGLASELVEHAVEARIRALEGDDRARVDYETHGSSGGQSRESIASSASANSGSGGPAERHAAKASASVARFSVAGTRRATVVPLRSTTNVSPR